MYVFWLMMLTFAYLDVKFDGSKNETAYFVTTIVITTFVIFYWLLEDAKDINVTPSSSLKIGVIAISFIAVPYYLIKYKGIKRASLSFAKFSGFILVFGIITYIIDTYIYVAT